MADTSRDQDRSESSSLLGSMTGDGVDSMPTRPPAPEPGRRGRNDAESREAGVLVIGLGRFGSSIALTLDRLGHEVLAVERSSDLVHHFTGRFPLVEADASNPEALAQVGAKEFSVAVVGVGTSLEASVLITGNLVDLGTPQIWAKATSNEHARILHRIGAHHVVLPEDRKSVV